MSTMYKSALQPLICHESEQAEVLATIECVKQRVVRQCAAALNVDLAALNDNVSKIYIHPSVKDLINKDMLKFIKLNSLSSDEYNVYEKFCHNDLIKKLEAVKLISILVKKHLKDRDDEEGQIMGDKRKQAKEKIVCSSRLPRILAIDGTKGIDNGDFKNYIENLSVSAEDEENKRALNEHVRTIRQIYKCLPKQLSGTDAVHLVRIVFLNCLSCPNSENALEVQKVIEESEQYLLRNVRYCPQIEECLKTTGRYIEDYQNAFRDVNKSDLKRMLLLKANDLLSHQKKMAKNNAKSIAKKRKVEDESTAEDENLVASANENVSPDVPIDETVCKDENNVHCEILDYE